VVATPIGNRDDLSPRAVAVLRECHVIYAEDTRHSRPLLQYHNIETPLRSLHEHNESARAAHIIKHCESEGPVAIISDAGTPLISDPGYRIVRAAQEADIPVSPIPGASALVAALSVAGLPTDRFLFAGFPPNKTMARKQFLQELATFNCTLVLYESPHRILATLDDIVTVFGDSCEMAVGRELTKRFETVIRDSAGALRKTIESDADQQRGEFVIMLSGGKDKRDNGDLNEATAMLPVLLKHVPLKTAAKIASELTGQPRKTIYEYGITLSGDENSH